MEVTMKKLALIVTVLMLLSMIACTNEDGNLGNNNNNNTENIGDEIEDGIRDTTDDIEGGMRDAVDDIQEGANADNNNVGGERELTGTAQGYGGEVTVRVRLNGDDIVSVEAMGEDETSGVGSLAIEQLPEIIEQKGSTDVDNISGATMTSEAIKEAVNQAIEKNK